MKPVWAWQGGGEVGGGERDGKEQNRGQMAAASRAASRVRTSRPPGGRGKLAPGARPEPNSLPPPLEPSLHFCTPCLPMPSDCSALTMLGLPSPSPQMQP